MRGAKAAHRALLWPTVEDEARDELEYVVGNEESVYRLDGRCCTCECIDTLVFASDRRYLREHVHIEEHRTYRGDQREREREEREERGEREREKERKIERENVEQHRV